MKHPPTPYPTQGSTTNPQPNTDQPIRPQPRPKITNPTANNPTHPNTLNQQPPPQNPPRITRSASTNQPHQSLHTPHKPRTNRLYQRTPYSCAPTPFRKDDSLIDIPELSIGEPAVSLKVQKAVFRKETAYVEDRCGGWVNFWERGEWEVVQRRRVEKGSRRRKGNGKTGKSGNEKKGGDMNGGNSGKGVRGRKRGNDGRFI